ncbi:TerD family protein [Streptomyces sp. AP-93]|uniref:TerD family protein n=1 Tax=Streptomyces sp. AP-93 TaxID=2929048 RepID=UPI002435CF5C|nr:TerD family protein [Streptomyces sp. AP-93]
MIKGGNAFVPTVPLRFAVRSGLDVAALLLTERGRVRWDTDIVFHGAPVHPSGAVRLLGDENGTAWLEAALTAIEEEIVRVVVVASTGSGTMRDVPGLSVDAFAPDGTSVARYDVTDAGDETAMVLAELYRRSGGWKFRAVGQGYLNGLAGLVADHGVNVADAPPVAVPVPVAAPAPMAPAGPVGTPVPFQIPAPGTAPAPNQTPAPFQVPAPAPAPAPVPFQAPAQIPAPAPAPYQSPAPAPYQAPTPYPVPVPAPVPMAAVAAAAQPAPEMPAAHWLFGGAFEPYAKSGRDNDVITVNGLPPGPVVVELAIRGDGYTGLWPLTRFNKEGDNLISSCEKNFRGRVLTQVPGNGRLRLKLEAEGSWQLRVLPLAAATHLTEDELEGGGPDVLLHTGGTADLVLRYRGSDNLIVYLYELAGHDDPAELPEGENVVNEIGKRRETVPLPEGPVIVQLEMADGPWRARLTELEPHSDPSSAGGVAKVTDTNRPQGQSWWGRS